MTRAFKAEIPPLVLTVGHSTRSLTGFIELLQAHSVTQVIDVRTVPRSRHNPQFNADTLPAALAANGMGYEHVAGLGGFRRSHPGSLNTGWRNLSFRGYADYMQTVEFEECLAGLMAKVVREQIVLMCAEAVPWRCHRSLIADALLVHGIRVEEIVSPTRTTVHGLTSFARVSGTRITYPPVGSAMSQRSSPITDGPSLPRAGNRVPGDVIRSRAAAAHSPGTTFIGGIMSRFIVPKLLPALLLLAAATGLQAQATPPDLSDAEVAHVAVTANSIDIELARVALSQTSNAEVQKFAGTMLTDHTAVNRQAGALASRLGVTPEDNPVSRWLQHGAKEARDAIEGLRGAAFDQAYMDREIAYHQAVLNALDEILIPTTSNAELRKLLVDVRPAFAAHLEHARIVRTSLGSGR